MSKYKVLKAFDQAVDCRTIVSHAEDDLITVPEDKVDEWAEAGFIDDNPVNDDKSIDKMNKAELLAYASANHDIELDKSDKKDDLIAQIKELEG